MATSAYAVKPDSVYHRLPTDFGLSIEETQILTTDSFSINTWIYEPDHTDSTTQTIILVASDGGNMGALITHAFYLRHSGLRVISFDYRGFGHSSKYKFDSTVFYYPEFEKDLSAVVNYTYTRYGKPVYILAFSLGTLVTLNCISSDTLRYDKIILDGLVSNPEAVVKRVKRIKKKKKLTYTAFNHSIFKVPNNPTLVFSARLDDITTSQDALDFQNQNSNCILILFNGPHLGGLQTLQNRYFGFISKFLE